MPDFDVETVGRMNKLDKVKLDILNRRQATIDSYKEYMKYQNRGHAKVGLDAFKIELGSLFIEVRQMINRELNNEKIVEGTEKEYSTLKQIQEDIQSDSVDRVEKAFNYIESLLYQKRITAIDTRESVDPSDIFLMNKKGFY
jgi:3-hydroxy-3-methylglutaryl CoA synthase